jgi:hypothetical protein
MRTETTTRTIYTFDELSETAKEKAFEEWLKYAEYFFADDNAESLKKFCEIFPVKVKDWKYGYRYDISASFDIDPNAEELTGVRLQKYLWNNYGSLIYQGKYYSKGQYKDGKYTYKQRRSKVLKQKDCVLSGYWIDHELLTPIYTFLDSRNPSGTFEDLLQDCLNSWLIACQKDYEHSFSYEYFQEEMTETDNEYTEEGKEA